MPYFIYTAKNSAGDTRTGEIEAVSESAVADSLMREGFFPLSISEKQEVAVDVNKKKKINLVAFTRQLYILVRSGVPISRALKSLEITSENPGMRELFKDIRTTLDNGYELYFALQKHPKTFSPFYINMVRVGELTGRLEEILMELYKFLEFEEEMKTRAKTALRYPIFVLSIMMIVFTVMMVFVIPIFGDIYKGFKAELPWPTQALISTSNFMMHYGIILLVSFVGMLYMFLSYIKTPVGEFWWGKFKMDIPVIGKILKKSVLARFSNALSLSIKSGIPVVQSLNNVIYVLENKYFEQHIENIKQSIERGNTLYGSMKNVNVFEPLVLEMISTGEEAGELEAMCDEISFMYEKEIDYSLKNLNSYIEPILLLILGGLLLILALGIFLPIWDLSTVVTKK